MIVHRNSKFYRGFTLIELMVVVVIIGVLASVATYGVTKYLRSAKSTEAFDMINMLKAAEESYRDERMVYLDVSAGSLGNSHPRTTPSGNTKYSWEGDGDNAAVAQNFKRLGVSASGPVHFVYAAVAGTAGSSFPSLPTAKQDFNFPGTATAPYYVILGKADLDGDSVFQYALSHSLTTEVYIEGEGE